MRFLLLIFIILPFNVTNGLRVAGKSIHLEKKGKVIDGNWIEDAVETTAVTAKDGTKTVSSSVSESVKSKKGVQPVSSTALRQTITATTVLKSAALPYNKTQKQFFLDAMKEINQKRRSHGVKALASNETLRKLALEMAKKLAKNKDIHSKVPLRKGIGQNIYYKTSIGLNVELHPKDAPENWYKEMKSYNFSKEPTPIEAFKSAHFTQMIWKDTTEVGIAFAKSFDKKMAFVVGLFTPQGNHLGDFKNQVLPLEEKIAVDEEVGAASTLSPDDDFKLEILKAHNRYRKIHHVEPLELSDELCKLAQKWADHLAKLDRMMHSSDRTYGENLYACWSSDPTVKPSPSDPVRAWYDEIQSYNFNQPTFHSTTGHFTQVVWKGSKRIGAGIAQNPTTGKIYVVVNYDPPGNVRSHFPTNVLSK